MATFFPSPFCCQTGGGDVRMSSMFDLIRVRSDRHVANDCGFVGGDSFRGIQG
jgi:hypothetical protein